MLLSTFCIASQGKGVVGGATGFRRRSHGGGSDHVVIYFPTIAAIEQNRVLRLHPRRPHTTGKSRGISAQMPQRRLDHG